MGKMILVTGGSRSGKSSYAEKLAKSYGNEVLYIATSVPFDEEMKERVRLHRASRPSHWETFEAYRDLKRAYEKPNKYEVVLLDCITVMVTNLLFEATGEDFDTLEECEFSKIEGMILKEIEDFINASSEQGSTLIIVTNELGSGLVPEYKSGRIFRDIAGRVNQYIASRVDEVYFTVCGLPMKIK